MRWLFVFMVFFYCLYGCRREHRCRVNGSADLEGVHGSRTLLALDGFWKVSKAARSPRFHPNDTL